jgi:hypothetical protein
MQHNFEKREKRRRTLIRYLDVRDRTDQRLMGCVADLTERGFLLVGTDSYAPGAELSIRIEIPLELQRLAGEALDMVAVACWSGSDVNPDYTDTGFKFAGATDSQRMAIGSIVARIGFQD